MIIKNSTEIAYIYALIDPISEKIRYIGKTINPKDRLSSHISESKVKKHHRANWIKLLASKGEKPIFKILEVCPLCEFIKVETFYIKKYKSNNLTNSDTTGQGNVNRKREIIEKAALKNSKTVYRYNLDGNYIDEYISVRNAAKSLDISHSNISRCCNHISKHAGGFIFRYVKTDNVESISNPNAVKKGVNEITKEGAILSSWSSIAECAVSVNIDSSNISRVCSGILPKIKGRYFEFS